MNKKDRVITNKTNTTIVHKKKLKYLIFGFPILLFSSTSYEQKRQSCYEIQRKIGFLSMWVKLSYCFLPFPPYISPLFCFPTTRPYSSSFFFFVSDSYLIPSFIYIGPILSNRVSRVSTFRIMIIGRCVHGPTGIMVLIGLRLDSSIRIWLWSGYQWPNSHQTGW